MKDEYRICTKCKIWHYENCENCYGFGVYSDKEGAVVSAGQAHDHKEGKPRLKTFSREPETREPKPCPTCGSTIEGLPKGIKIRYIFGLRIRKGNNKVMVAMNQDKI